jgi:hypothetical protein
MSSSKSVLTAILLSALLFVASAAFGADTATTPAKAAPPAAATTPAATAKPAAPATAAATAKPAAAPAKHATAPKAPKAEAGGPRSIVGEVVDPACWIINGSSGKGHAECAAACAKAGQTLAILEKKTNKLYILAGEKPGEDPNKGVVEYIGQPVLVKGRVFARGGALGIQITSIEPYNPKLSAATP